MKTIPEISSMFRSVISNGRIRQADLRERAGVSQRTLTNVLSGQEDFKVSTMLALADRLGLELVLVPKEASQAVSAGTRVTPPRIQSKVQKAVLSANLNRMLPESRSGWKTTTVKKGKP